VEKSDYVGLITKEEKKGVFRKGMVICIKHPRIFEPILNVIQKVEDDVIFFKIPEIFLKSNVLKGDDISCQVLKEDAEYVAEGIVSNINIRYPSHAEFSIGKIHRYKNYRKARRFLVDFPGEIHIQGADKRIYSIIKNLGPEGLGMIFKENINENTLVDVAVTATVGKNELLELKAKIIRVLPRSFYNEYGMKIVDMDDANRSLLNKLLFYLEQNESLFVAECLK
jgi:hypothetical protein